MRDGEPQYRCTIRHNDEEPGLTPPGVESVTIRLHMPASRVKATIKPFELLPDLLHALGVLTGEPGLLPEQQTLLETARRQMLDSFRRGGELPPMAYEWETINPDNAILRVHLYLPKVIGDRARVAQECQETIHLANEVAGHRW